MWEKVAAYSPEFTVIAEFQNANHSFPFNWNVPILVGNDCWTCQEAVYANKLPFTIMYSIFGIYGKGIILWGSYWWLKNKALDKKDGPANMKRYQLFLWESTEWFPPENTVTCLKNNTVIVAISVHGNIPSHSLET